jgi:hypothetical protein
MSIPSYNNAMLSDDNYAKRRLVKNMNKKYDAKRVKIEQDLKSQIKGIKEGLSTADVKPAVQQIISLGIQSLSSAEELSSLLSQSINNRTYTGAVNLSKATSLGGKLMQNYRVMYQSLTTLVPVFNFIKPADKDTMQSFLAKLNNLMQEIADKIQSLDATPASDELERIIGLADANFQDLMSDGTGGADLFNVLDSQYNYGKPTNAQRQIISDAVRDAIGDANQAIEADVFGDGASDSTYVPSSTNTSTTGSGTYATESDDDDSLDGAGRSGGFLSAHPFQRVRQGRAFY